MYYQLAGEAVIWEKMGAQIVMANLNTGRYCNLSESSALIVWACIILGMSDTEVYAKLATIFDGDQAMQKAEVDEFLQKLVKLEFLVVADSQVTAQDEGMSSFLKDQAGGQVFAPPKLLFYDDIDTLLQLDPIDDEVAELLQEAP